MKKIILLGALAILALVIVACASGGGGGGGSAPQLGEISEAQKVLNEMPAVPVAGNNLKFQFGGETWIATNNGVNFLAGSFTSTETEDGTVLELTQTHAYSTTQKPVVGGDIGWVPTPGPSITLVENEGSLSTK